MNVHNNKRRQETIRRIEEVFLECLKTQELSQIKVSHICKKAEINRSTFYANFIDIYDLVDKIQIRLENEVIQLLEQEVYWQCSDKDFLKLFQHMKENQNLYLFYFKLGSDRKQDLKLCDVCLKDIDLDVEFVDYHIAFFKNGFNAIVKKWLDGGCEESPQQMKDILLGEYRGRVFKTS